MKVALEKPGTPGELVHHGVKGMQWGHRRHATSTQRTRSIQRARAQSFQDATAFRTAPKGSAKREQAKKVFLKNPDRATQLRLTRGEKVTLGILAGTVVFAPSVAIGVGTRVAVRKSIERKQARRAYG